MSNYCKWTRNVRTNAYIISRYEIERLKDSRNELDMLSLHISYPSAEWLDYGDCAEFAFERSLKSITKSWKSKKKCRQYLRHSKVGCTKSDLALIRAKKRYDLPEYCEDETDWFGDHLLAAPSQDTAIENTIE